LAKILKRCKKNTVGQQKAVRPGRAMTLACAIVAAIDVLKV
jgi:hypothetical protein